MTVGILALQGDFREHEQTLGRIGVPTLQVRLPKHLERVDRLIIPGGESTTIGKLLVIYKLLDPICARARRGMPLWGTCAGAILLAQRIGNRSRDAQMMIDPQELRRLREQAEARRAAASTDEPRT